MKIRKGYVSNSSSASFIVDAEAIGEEKAALIECYDESAFDWARKIGLWIYEVTYEYKIDSTKHHMRLVPEDEPYSKRKQYEICMPYAYDEDNVDKKEEAKEEFGNKYGFESTGGMTLNCSDYVFKRNGNKLEFDCIMDNFGMEWYLDNVLHVQYEGGQHQ